MKREPPGAGPSVPNVNRIQTVPLGNGASISSSCSNAAEGADGSVVMRAEGGKATGREQVLRVMPSAAMSEVDRRPPVLNQEAGGPCPAMGVVDLR